MINKIYINITNEIGCQAYLRKCIRDNPADTLAELWRKKKLHKDTMCSQAFSNAYHYYKNLYPIYLYMQNNPDKNLITCFEYKNNLISFDVPIEYVVHYYDFIFKTYIIDNRKFNLIQNKIILDSDGDIRKYINQIRIHTFGKQQIDLP